VNEELKHLDIEQIDRLVRARSEDETDVTGAEGLEDARRHLMSCEFCQKLVSMERENDQVLRGLRVNSSAGSSTDCPSEIQLYDLAGGLTREKEAEKLLAHASQCEHCGPILRRVTEELNSDQTADEEAAIARLATSQRDWQQNLAFRLSSEFQRKTSRQEKSYRTMRLGLSWQRWLLAVTGVLLIAFAGWNIFRPVPESRAANLLTSAYTEQRPIEMRLPNAHHAPLRVERGTEISRLNRPAALLEAEALVAKNLALHPSDPSWISLKGRIDLLEGNEEAAIASFQQAASIDPKSMTIKVDLASAYFERAESEGRAADYGLALDSLSQALAQDPNNVVALFNRAIVAERMFLYQNALEDWQHYLRIDPTGDWSKEARDRMSAIEKHIKDRSQSEPTFLRGTDSYLQWTLDTQHNEQNDGDDVVDELALQEATANWLSQEGATTVSEDSGSSNEKTRNALYTLAGRLEVRHQDMWLKTMLSVPRSERHRSGVSALVVAVREDLSGNPIESIKFARTAADLFSETPGNAGWLRARLEEVYALHRAGQGQPCAEEGLKLPQRMSRNGYAWMEAQAYLELFNCRILLGDIDGAEKALDTARVLTEKFHYPILRLRVAGFEASLATQKGDAVQTWARSRNGLTQFWSNFYPAVRGYHFYSEIGSEEADSGRAYTAILFMKEATALIATSSLRSAEAEERFLLASQAQKVGMIDLAQSEFRRSEAIFATLPENSATLAYRAEAEIALAQIEGIQGRLESASGRLRNVRSGLSGLSTFSVLLNFYGASGRVAMLQGAIPSAERNLRTAMNIAESGLSSLSNETDGLTWDNQTRQIYRDLIQVTWKQGNFEGALDLWEWYRAAPLRITNKRATKVVLDAVQLEAQVEGHFIPQVSSIFEDLDSTTIISYAFLDGGIAIWKFDNRGLKAIFQQIDPSEVKQAAVRFTRECGDMRSDDQILKRDGKELYNWLLAPVISDSDFRRTIVIEPDGLLNLLPFGALVDPTGKFIGTRFPIELSLGVAYASLARPAHSFSPKLHALIVSAPASTGNALKFPPLPDTKREANAISARFPQSISASGKTATIDFVRKEIQKAEIFHFAGHSLVRADHLFLVLAPKSHGANFGTSDDASLLDASLFRKNLCRQCTLAVFSACSSAMALDGNLFDPSNIPRAVLSSGVPHAVASLWAVDSSTTADYMDGFYESLLNTDSVAVATQRAAAKIREAKNTSHPYFWAAFAAYGVGSTNKVKVQGEENNASN